MCIAGLFVTPIFEEHTADMRAVVGTHAAHEYALDFADGVAPIVRADRVRTMLPLTVSPKHQAQADQRRAQRVDRCARARVFYAHGWSIRAIGRDVA